MKKKLIILSAGGIGREVAQIALDREATNTVEWEFVGFLDPDPGSFINTNYDLPLLGNIDDWHPSEDELYISASGCPDYREESTLLLEERGAIFTNVIHPTAVISDSARYENGLVVYPYTCITTHNYIGKHVMIHLHNAIGHDTYIGDYSVLSSFCDITGHVKLGKKVFLGSHVTIAPRLEVGDGAHVGIGSVVVSPVKAGKRLFGNPAKVLEL